MFQLLERTGLDDDPKAAALVGAAAVHPSPHVAEKIQQLVSLKAAKRYRYPFPDGSERSDLATRQQNRIDVGTTFTGSSYTLDANDLTKHLLVVGTTGMGKTTFFYHLMDELPVPYWSFDLKTDYRHLRRRNPDLLVVPWTRLRLNPLRPPPQVRPRTWAQTVDELIGDSYSLYSGSQNYLLPILIDMYEEHDIDVDTGYSQAEVGDLPWPRFPQLKAYLQQSSRTGAARTQLRNRLVDRFSSILAATGSLYTRSHGYPLAELLQRDVVFELQGLKTDHQDFLIELLLTWVFRFRQARQQRGDGLQHAFVLDEGKRAFSIYKERDDTKGLPQIDVLTAQLREFGEALLVGDQEPSKLTDALHSNTGTTVMFRIEEGEQFRAMTRSMQLSERQRSFADRLDVGQAIVKQGGRDAAPVQFPDMAVEKDVTNEELQNELQSVWRDLAGSTEPILGADETAEALENPAAADATASETAETADSVSPDVHDLLVDIVQRPFQSVTDRYDLFSSSGKAFNVKQKALEQELVREKWIQDGSKFKVLELTQQGREYLRGEDVAVRHDGRGGIVHRYWQHHIRMAFTDAGHEAAIEEEEADVAVSVGDRQIAIEVATRAANREVEHVRDRLTDGFDAVWIACRNGGVRSQLRTMLENAELYDERRVRLLLFQDATDVDGLLS